MDHVKHENTLVDAAYDEVHVNIHKEGGEGSYLIANEINTIHNSSASGGYTGEDNGARAMGIDLDNSNTSYAAVAVPASGSNAALTQSVDETKHQKKSKGVAPIRNLYVSSIAYNIFTITDGAARMIILFHTAALGFDAWDIAIMFSIYEVAGVFINLYAGVAGQIFGLKVVMMMSLVLQLISLTLLIVVPTIFGNLTTLSTQQRANVTAYITFAFALGGGAKDFMKLVGKSVPKLVTEEEEGALFKIVAMLTGAKNSFKGFGFFFGSLLIWSIGYEWSLFVLIFLFCQ